MQSLNPKTTMNYQELIEEIYSEVKSGENSGDVASYIPELEKVNTDKFGISLTTIDNENFSTGESNEKFSIQSIAKVLSLALVYKTVGGKLWERVGVEPSGTAFNSLVQLEYELGIPRNPMINAGAIVVCDLLISQFDDPKNELISFIRNISNCPTINYNQTIVESEKSMGFRNAGLINFIKSFGNIHNKIEQVLDLYYNLCSIEMTCQELSQTFLFLANYGKNSLTNNQILTISQSKRVNAIMQSCGFYDESGEFAYRVGLPGKSGVGGGIIAVHPNKYTIAVWSPRLNKKGNSFRGMKFLEQFTSKTEFSIF
ncbi:MAG: glutaminase [Bacteroidota bacterium]|nr:glutaminase [Bacteroidota bacterium]